MEMVDTLHAYHIVSETLLHGSLVHGMFPGWASYPIHPLALSTHISTGMDGILCYLHYHLQVTSARSQYCNLYPPPLRPEFTVRICFDFA